MQGSAPPQSGLSRFLGTKYAKPAGLAAGFAICFLLVFAGALSRICLGLVVAVLLYAIPKLFGVKSFKVLAVYGLAFLLATSAALTFAITVPMLESDPPEDLGGGFTGPAVMEDGDACTFTVTYEPGREVELLYAEAVIAQYKMVGPPPTSGIPMTETHEGSGVYTAEAELGRHVYVYSFESGGDDGDGSGQARLCRMSGSDLTTFALGGNLYYVGVNVTIIFFLIAAMVSSMGRKLEETRAKMEEEGRLYPQGYGRCKECGGVVLPGEVCCRKCGAYIDVPEEMRVEKAESFRCSECGAEVPADAERCPKCGAAFDEETEDVVVDDASAGKRRRQAPRHEPASPTKVYYLQGHDIGRMRSDENELIEAAERGSVAQKLAAKQQEISVTEFFEKNKHILGFDSKAKSLLMGIKEAVDNSLDACEEANTLPDIVVKIARLDDDEYKIYVEDNGPGIIHRMMPNVFGRLLYGSRFHALRQSRGQQGIGISATIMYGNITTGKAAHVQSKIEGVDAVAWGMDIVIDTKVNRPVVTNDRAFVWDGKDHGTSIEYTIKGRYITGKQSIFEYLKNTAIVNPHSMITFTDPDGKTFIFERATEIMPVRSKEIKPHPEGIEIGDLLKMAQNTSQKTVKTFLTGDFSRVTPRIANEILAKAEVKDSGKPASLTHEDCKRIVKAISEVKIMAPQTDCLSPIGDVLIKKGLMHVLDGLRPAYYAQPVTRAPKAVNGNPFVIEAGIVYGGDIPAEGEVTILRFANRVPLLYQPGACAITKAVQSVDWRRYGLEQRGGKGTPFGPAIFLVHVASTKVPFTSEGKEAVANLPEIMNEIVLALKLCARNLKSHLNKEERKSKTHAKFEVVQEILPELAAKTAEHLGRPVPNIDRTISKIMNVVWVEPAAENERKRKHRKITYTVYNYTRAERSLCLHAHLPKEATNMTLYGDERFQEVNEEGKATWKIEGLAPASHVSVSFDLDGEMADTFSVDDIYISGINPVIVMGAEQLPGDWGIKGMEIVEIDSDIESLEEEEREEELEEEEEKEAKEVMDDE